MHQLEKLTLFYDGACPLCQAEIVFLTKRNQAGLLHFVDINSPNYDANQVGVSCDQALASMYAQYESGTFCLLYTSPSPRDRTRSRMPSSA